ncbi:MAG: 50S ribosomal protein L16 [Candidatus Pacearchaeota archaeon]|nr:50S ribosomal protein L16 [Candidatus Pacearchaeota archaeon]
MAIRRSSAYSKKTVVPYTRTSKQKSKAYVKTVPPSKIVKFSMGNLNLFREGKLQHILILATAEKIQIRQNAIEACRQYIHKKLDEELGGPYFFRVIPFAHHIQRENKMLTGAGSDRMQKGMQLSFGKTIAKAAILRKNDPIFSAAVQSQKAVSFVRKTYKQVKSKLPCTIKMIYEFSK